MSKKTYYTITYILALPVLIVIRTIGFTGNLLVGFNDFIENKMCSIREKGYKKLSDMGVIK